MTLGQVPAMADSLRVDPTMCDRNVGRIVAVHATLCNQRQVRIKRPDRTCNIENTDHNSVRTFTRADTTIRKIITSRRLPDGGQIIGSRFSSGAAHLQLGTVGMVSDAQLLDWFVSSKDESAEAAFEELMIRHGPMVFGICKNVLRDAHDAQDAFQAVFMVLANRASSIRRKNSVASWLFGVAQRVAARARSRAARRRSIDQEAAEQASECYIPPEHDPDRRYCSRRARTLTRTASSTPGALLPGGSDLRCGCAQLALSEGTLRGRLSQARKRLRGQLTRRGVTVPAGLLAAGASTQLHAAVPHDLVRSTIQIAQGSTSLAPHRSSRGES